MQKAEIITGADIKIMLYSWGANNEQILADNLIDLGLEVVWYDKPCRHYTRDAGAGIIVKNVRIGIGKS